MASSRPLHTAAERARHFRALAEGTCRLADECDVPELIEDYLRIAARLNMFAEAAEAEAKQFEAEARRTCTPGQDAG